MLDFLLTENFSNKINVILDPIVLTHEHVKPVFYFIRRAQDEIAVAASDIPEISTSQIQNGQHGLLIPVGDAGALAGAISCLIQDAQLRRRLATAALERARSRFTIEHVDRLYQKLYSRLLDRNGSSEGAAAELDLSVAGFDSRI